MAIRRKSILPSGMRRLQSGKLPRRMLSLRGRRTGLKNLTAKANPQRYRLSSGAELIGYRFLGNNPYTVTLKIWTKVKNIEHTAVTYLSDSDKRLKAFWQWRTDGTRVCQRLFQCSRASQRDTSQFAKCCH